jgi:hypothetical protein
MKAQQPKILRCETSGLFLLQASLGVMSVRAWMGEAFHRIMAYSKVSNQYISGRFTSLSITCVFSRSVLLCRSNMPLCCSVCGMVISWCVPLIFRNDSNSLLVYSLPLLLLNSLSHYPDCSSSCVRISMKFWNTLDFSQSPATNTFLEQSSMSMTKYLYPWCDVVRSFPQTSEKNPAQKLV